MRVLFLTKYPRRGPSSRYRVFQFIPYLEREGLTCEVQCLHSDEYLECFYSGGRKNVFYTTGRLFRRVGKVFEASRYSVVFIQKELFPYFPPILERYISLCGARIVYDIDDAIFLFYTDAGSKFVRSLLAGKIPRVLELSDVVLAGNRFLMDYAIRHNRNTVFFPTVVDPSRYTPRGGAGNVTSRNTDRERPVIGWIGSAETVRFLLEKLPVLNELSGRIPFKLLVIGASGSDIPGLEVEAVPWSEDTEAGDLGRCDIGIMPLPDTQWAEGKCGLKILQYMASGLPVVTSPGGGASDIVRDGESGLIARSDEQWLDQLAALLGDQGLRRRIGEAGRLRIVESYSLDLWAPRMATLLKKVANGEKPDEKKW